MGTPPAGLENPCEVHSVPISYVTLLLIRGSAIRAPGWVEQRRSGRGRPPEFTGGPAAERDPAPPLGEADLAVRAAGRDRSPRPPPECRQLPRGHVEPVRRPRGAVPARPP